MNARRRSFTNAKEEFKRTVSESINDLEEKHGFSREHAVQSVLHEIVTFTGASAPVDEEMVFKVMRLHGLCWEEALRALVVSNAIDRLAKDTTSVSVAVQNLTNRLRQAELWKHSAMDISPVIAISRSVVAPRILHPVPAVSDKTFHNSHDTREAAKREKREVEPPIPIPTEITAVSGFDVEDATASKVNNPASKNAAKTSSTRKRPVDTNSGSSKPDAANRKPTRAAKRNRETVAEEECSAKRPC